MASSLFKLLCVFFAITLHGVPSAAQDCMLNTVCFALDQSGSITNPGFYPEVRQFTVRAARAIGARTTGTKYSAIGFSTRVKSIQAATASLEGVFVPAVNRVPPLGGGTDIGAGLRACYDELVGLGGNRVVVLVTDGRSGNPSAVRNLIIAAGIKVVTVGIGRSVNSALLRDIATRPDFFISVANTAELVAKAADVANDACEVAVVPMSGGCQAAYDQCEFQFKGKNAVPEYSIRGKPDMVFTDAIVSKKEPHVGVLNTNGIVVEFIPEMGAAQPITMFGKPRLTPTHFKPFSMPYPMIGSGIGHQTFTGNQRGVSRKRCVRIYFTQYQTVTMGPNPHVIDNVNAKKSDKKCVVFKTM